MNPVCGNVYKVYNYKPFRVGRLFFLVAMSNPRYANGSARRKIRERWRAIGAPCALCGKPIDYSLGYIVGRDGKKHPHPMSFVVDEKIPISRYREGGYESPTQAALDFSNTQPAHYMCNARKGNGRKPKKVTQPLPQPWDL